MLDFRKQIKDFLVKLLRASSQTPIQNTFVKYILKQDDPLLLPPVGKFSSQSSTNTEIRTVTVKKIKKYISNNIHKWNQESIVQYEAIRYTRVFYMIIYMAAVCRGSCRGPHGYQPLWFQSCQHWKLSEHGSGCLILTDTEIILKEMNQNLKEARVLWNSFSWSGFHPISRSGCIHSLGVLNNNII